MCPAPNKTRLFVVREKAIAPIKLNQEFEEAVENVKRTAKPKENLQEKVQHFRSQERSVHLENFDKFTKFKQQEKLRVTGLLSDKENERVRKIGINKILHA